MSYLPLIEFGQAIAPAIGETFYPLPHVRTICEELELVFAGVTQYLMIFIPPRHGKTLPTSQLFPAWCYGMSPASKFILASYGATLADNNSDMVRKIMATEEYKRIFPWVTAGDRDQRGDWTTNHNGVMSSVGRDGAITGKGAGGLSGYFEGAIILDDLLKANEATSDLARNSAINFITRTIENRRNSNWTPIILIMQRLHPNDPAGWILKNNFLGPWKVVKLKGLNDDGTALWPDRKTAEQWNELKELDEFAFYSQGQQEPIMPGGNLCQRDWWHRWTPATLKDMVAGFITVDTSYGKDKRADYTVMQLWLYGSNGLCLYDQDRGIWKTPEIIERLKSFYFKHKPDNPRELPISGIYIEDKASGTSVAQALEADGIWVEYWQPKGDKAGRFKDSLPGIKYGRTMIPPDDYAPWVPVFVDEHSEFSADMGHDYDDQCDAQSMADNIYRSMYGGISG